MKLGFLGAGKMATALARGFVEAGLAKPDELLASDPLPAAGEAFSSATGGKATRDNGAVLEHAKTVFLAVKPQHLPAVLTVGAAGLTSDHLLISIAAGVRLARIAELVGEAPRLVRVMPNTPCLIGQSASGYCLGPNATADDAQLVEKLLAAVGRCWAVDESLLDAVTGLSGSGPAFVYVMIEALSDGGVRMGLPRDLATALAAQTVTGAAAMVLESGDHPAVLKDRVTSPGGTTIAGLQALEAGGARAAMIAAVEAATRRSQELGA